MSKNIKELIKQFILDSKVPLPKTKNIDQAVDLFINGARLAQWNHITAKRFTDKFPQKRTGANRHFYWVLEHLSLKLCPKCDLIKGLEDFHSNLGRLDGKQCVCIDCYSLDQKENPERWRGYAAARKASKLNATPAWSNQKELSIFYENCPEGYHVDHIVPLQGQNVCGLHVINNLQYLPALDNLRKSNKF